MKLLSVCHSILKHTISIVLNIITFSGDSRHFNGLRKISTTTLTIKVFHFNEDSWFGYWEIPQTLKSERTRKDKKARNDITTQLANDNSNCYYVKVGIN